MTNNSRPNQPCLTDEDLYRYLSGQGGAERSGPAQAHLAECPSCRRNLAQLIELLHPEAGETAGVPDPSEAEVDRTLAVIREISRKEHPRRNRIPHWIEWPIAAAAAIGFVTLCLLGIRYLHESSRSQAFYSQARAMLEQSYTGTSPGNLRLSLPFSPAAANRSAAEPESLRMAENLFFQALAVRENMVEAHLGLGFIYLNESNFERARQQFEKVLEIRKDQSQALLGRGVARYEEAIRGSDPLQRDLLLKSAVNDFDAVLKTHPESAEARYNKIWTLFESGLHTKALEEIELYLSRDPGSIWAEGLKGLRTKMKATQAGAVEDEVDRAARTRDRAALMELSRQAPYQMPAAIWSAMRRGLAADGAPANSESPGSEDLYWAAEVMEAGYSAATGDSSFRAFIDFYNGLSPPERDLKRSLDRKFQSLVKLHQNGEFDLVLRGSKSLESQYTKIKDFWQLVNLHHLRGNSFYMGKADLSAAESEYRKMHRIANRLNAPDLISKALAALAMILGVQREFEDSLASANRLKELASRYNLDSWHIHASISTGHQFRRLGKLQEAMQEYSSAINIAYRLLDGKRIIEALDSSGIAMARLGRLSEAGAFYRLAVRELDSLLPQQVKSEPSLTVRRLNLIFRQGSLALRTGDFSKAEALFSESLESAPSGMHELEGRNRVGLAEACFRTGRIREAECSLEPALATLDLEQYPEVEWQARFMKARLLESTGHREEALESFRQSIKVLERIRQNVQSEDLRQSFLVNRYDPYRAVVGLLFESEENRQNLLEMVDRSKSATLKENLEKLDPGSPPDPTPHDDSPFTTVEYFFTEDRLLILVTAQGRVEAIARKISGEEMARRVEEFLDSIRRNDSTNFRDMAKRLYADLLAPVETLVFARKPETLVILPDGPLYLLPFAGLQDGAGRFLIEKTAFVFAPSRSVFHHCLVSGRGPGSANDNLVLLDGSAGLPNARDELAYISSLYQGSASVLNAKDLPISAPAMEKANIFHFSGHAVIQDGRPVLLLQKYPKESYLDCRDIRSWRMPRSKLVNLAGCSTGIGPLAEGEAPWGLIPAFLDAGAPAIIASLMEVDDASTKLLSCRFYDQLRKGSGIAKALQTAQLALLDAARSGSDAGPQSWIPYMLVGNPQ